MIRLAIRVPREHAEIVLAELLELAPAGVEEVIVGDAVEYAVFGAPGELPRLPDLRALAGGALVEVSTSEIPDDWHERWKEFHRAILIEPPAAQTPWRAPALNIRPPWEHAHERSDGAVLEIVIDPGQAFGTGAHATTRLCLELLLELAALERPHGPVLDVGTGSGVLAIAAAALGFAPVVGLDNEQESVAAARENALVNGADIEVRRFDLRSESLPHGAQHDARPPILLANLLRPLLLELAVTLAWAPAELIAGGLLREELDEVSAAFAGQLGLRERERRSAGEWGALWLSGAG
ncbi:MAG TPA: 50S ribosomal protein L11 methyltransferase [Solirubrobacteraceae bacterium]